MCALNTCQSAFLLVGHARQMGKKQSNPEWYDELLGAHKLDAESMLCDHHHTMVNNDYKKKNRAQEEAAERDEAKRKIEELLRTTSKRPHKVPNKYK